MKIFPEDTIVAISTPLGENGIGIVRLSGKEALPVIKKIFRPKSKNIYREEIPTHTLHYGHISSNPVDPVDPVNKILRDGVDENLYGANGTVVDEVLVSVMRAPRTYTREDVVEINCHGGIVPLTKVLELCLKNGARLAQPGEFTQRAYLNGRIDLTQAEAVCDLIRAKTELASKIALQQLQGNLSQKIKFWREELVNLLAHLEVSLDYSEEDINFLSLEEIEKRIKKILSAIEELLQTADTGKILREGVRTVIVGKPNVGKSSLLNILLREERAIVTPLPGTTRDIIEETVNLRGVPLVIMDTAGIREHSQDLVEKIGIERSKKTIEESELILFVLDLAQPLNAEDIYIAQLIHKFNPQAKVIIAGNKIDLPSVVTDEEILRLQINNSQLPLVKICATSGEGIDELEKKIYQSFLNAEIAQTDSIIVSNLRHKESLIQAKEALIKALEAVKKKLSFEFIVLDLREGLNSLGEITGQTITEEILERIFSQFCVGK